MHRPRCIGPRVRASPKRIRIAFITDKIAPGGGPPGYVHALLLAHEEHGAPGLDVRFGGVRRDRRTSALGTAGAPGTAARWRRIAKRLLGPFTPGSRNRRRSRVLGRWSEIAVFHGPTSVGDLDALASDPRTTTMYMPHSPVPLGLESAAMGRGAEQVARELKDEAAVLMKVDRVVFPCLESTAPYVEEFGADILTRSLFIESGVTDLAHGLHVQDRAGEPASSGRILKALFVGRYVEHKGYDLFLDAARILSSEDLRLDFLSIGDGPLRQTSSHVTDLGWQEDPTPAMTESDFIVVPNRVAYFDLLPLEAASLSKGLVMTDVGGNVAQARRLPDSVVCHPEDLVSGIRQAVEQVRRLEDWGVRNRAAFEQHFTSAAMLRRWREALISTHSTRT